MYLKYLVTMMGPQENQTPIHDRQDEIRAQLLTRLKQLQSGNAPASMSFKVVRSGGIERLFVEERIDDREFHRWGYMSMSTPLPDDIAANIQVIENNPA